MQRIAVLALEEVRAMGWVRLAAASDFDATGLIGVEHGGVKVALYRVDGEFYATSNVCTHQAALLSQGEIVEGCIECPAHFGLFDIRTGKALGAPVSRDLPTYEVRLIDGAIFVDLPGHGDAS